MCQLFKIYNRKRTDIDNVLNFKLDNTLINTIILKLKTAILVLLNTNLPYCAWVRTRKQI